MTADALNSMEARLEAKIDQGLAEVKQDLAGVKQDLAGVKQDLAGVKHDVHLLSVKVDVGLETMGRQMDEGFRQVIQHIDRR